MSWPCCQWPWFWLLPLIWTRISHFTFMGFSFLTDSIRMKWATVCGNPFANDPKGMIIPGSAPHWLQGCPALEGDVGCPASVCRLAGVFSPCAPWQFSLASYSGTMLCLWFCILILHRRVIQELLGRLLKELTLPPPTISVSWFVLVLLAK